MRYSYPQLTNNVVFNQSNIKFASVHINRLYNVVPSIEVCMAIEFKLDLFVISVKFFRLFLQAHVERDFVLKRDCFPLEQGCELMR